MAAANFASAVVDALAGGEHPTPPGIRRDRAGVVTSASPTPAQRNATPRDLLIPKEVLALSITWSARLVLSEILNLQKVSGNVWANDHHFAERCRLSKRAVGNALRELERAGMLRRHTRQNAHPKRKLIPLLSPASPGCETKEIAETQGQKLPQPVAKVATDLMQNLPLPTANSAEINSPLNTSSKSNQTLIAEQGKRSGKDAPIAATALDADSSFEAFWNAYGKSVGLYECTRKWRLLSSSEHVAILAHVPTYVAETNDIKFRKNPLSYLNSRLWLDTESPTHRSAAAASSTNTSSPITAAYSVQAKLEKQKTSFLL